MFIFLMFYLIVKIVLTMTFQLAILFRLITGEFRLHDQTRPTIAFTRKYKKITDAQEFVNPFYHDDPDEAQIELVHAKDLLPSTNQDNIENVIVLHNDVPSGLSNVQPFSSGLNGFIFGRYVFGKKEDEQIYDIEFFKFSKMNDHIFLDWKNLMEKWSTEENN